MQLFDTTAILLQRAMAGASERQSVLANNLANANTPGFQRRDLDFQGALHDALTSGQDPSTLAFTPTVDTGAVLRADGNGVDVDTEAAGLAQNELQYESLVSVSSARLDILRYAMGIR
jgi:flagellar basal-body rod protein FlgB